MKHPKSKKQNHNFFSESDKVCANNKNKAIHRTLINLSRNKKNISCLNMDKGNGFVILNNVLLEETTNKVMKV